MGKIPTKPPGARLDYGVDWSPFLATTEGDVITEVDWLDIPEDLTLTDPALVEGYLHTAFLSGGVSGRVYKLTSRITTEQGRVHKATLAVFCR